MRNFKSAKIYKVLKKKTLFNMIFSGKKNKKQIYILLIFLKKYKFVQIFI